MLQRWEYQMLEQEWKDTNQEWLGTPSWQWVPEVDMQALGEKGWELVSVVPVNYANASTDRLRLYFKRPI